MSHSWRTGEVITADKLNSIEERVDANSYEVFNSQKNGLVPKPTGASSGRVLNENGLWVLPSYDSITRGILFNPDPYPIGDGYSESVDYTVGTYVIYNNTLYVCNSNCTHDTWTNNSSYFTETTVIGELNALRGLV